MPAEGWKRDGNRQVPLRGGSYNMTLDFVTDVAHISIDQVILGDPARVRLEVKTGAELLPQGSTTPSKTERDWLNAPKKFTTWVATS